jgi:GNAT superfamily N-acetyltransferase
MKIEPDEFEFVELYGQSIKSKKKEILDFLLKDTKRYPILFNGKDYELEEFFDSFFQEGLARVDLAFEGDKIIALAISLPMETEHDSFIAPVKDAFDFLDDYLSISYFSVLSEFQHRGIGGALLDKITDYAEKLNRSGLFHYELQRYQGHKLKPSTYLEDSSFWNKRGFTKPGLHTSLAWKDEAEKEVTTKTFEVWFFDLLEQMHDD